MKIYQWTSLFIAIAGLPYAQADDIVIDQVALQTEAIFDPQTIVANPMVGQQLFHTVYFNYDGAAVPSMTIEMVRDGATACEVTIPNFDSGNWVVFCNTPWTVESGKHTFEAILDLNNQISETDEQNNTGMVMFDIAGSGPTPTPTMQSTTTPGENLLYLFALSWLTQGFDPETLLTFLLNGNIPGLTPTPTPTDGGPTPTPTESGGSTFDFRDYFILANNSTWHYTGIQGTGTEDDFRWTVEDETQDIGGGKMATRIRTNTDEPSDEFNNHVDFWYKDPATGEIFFYGFHLPQPENFGIASIPVQDIVFTDPILIGGNGMTIGQTVIDSGTGEVNVVVFGNPQVTVGVVTSTIEFTGFLTTFETPLGTFTDVLRVVIDISAEVSGQTFEITNNTFFLKQGVGLIAQDQEPDMNDAEIQAIDEGQVAGVPITPN